MGIQFDENELKVKTTARGFRNSMVPVFSYPISMREGWKRAILDKKPVWIGTGVEVFNFYPDIIPDNRARGFVVDNGINVSDEEKGGQDMFGIHWTYVPTVGGSMETPGYDPLFEDANDWKEAVVFPDIDAWDWEGCAERNKEFLNNGYFNYLPLLNGFGFERLISFMGFENAAMALLDEDQEDALKELLDKLSDLYCEIVKKCCHYFDIDGFLIHDDWGSQRSPFFNFQIGKEFFVPNMKKVTDCIHSLGKVAELHSCGNNELQVENFIAGGWDVWGPMANINDTRMLFEKYGDKIIIGVKPDPYDPENDTEEEIRASARRFAEYALSNPSKTCIVNRYFTPLLNGVYAEELYRASREILMDRY